MLLSSVWILGGHMHDGGTAVKLYVNDKLVCSSDATYGSTGGTLKVEGKEWQTIARMSECRDGFKVKKGDYLTVSAQYDTKAHPA
jgi:Stress up-regulated Nod 19